MTAREEDVEIRVSSKGVKVDSTTRQYLMVAAALVLWTFGLLVLMPNRMFPHLPARANWVVGFSIAVSLAAFFTWIALRHKMARYGWLAAFSLALAGWMYARNGDPVHNILVMMTCLCGGWALLGALQLRTFLKTNPRIEDSGE